MMTDVTFAALKGALDDEGVKVEPDALLRAFRKLDNPGGCKHCGARVSLVREDPKSKGGLVLVCCGKKVGK